MTEDDTTEPGTITTPETEDPFDDTRGEEATLPETSLPVEETTGTSETQSPPKTNGSTTPGESSGTATTPPESESEHVTEAPVTTPETTPRPPQPPYEVDGDSIIADGVRVPNKNNFTSGPMVATDDLGRPLSTAEESKNYRGDRYVGVFYFLWLGEHKDYGIFDITKILAAGGEAAKSGNYSGWGPYGAMHFFAEPLYGYYYSSDEWVMRKHIEELTNANVDFLYIDVTNGYPYINNALKLMRIMHEFNEQGWQAPQIVFYTHTGQVNVVTALYNDIYAKNLYPDTWFYYDGKPVIVCDRTVAQSQLPSHIYNFFTFRNDQWPTEGKKQYGWPWMDFSHPQVPYYGDNDYETISVSVAQHSGTIRFSDSGVYGNNVTSGSINCGRSYYNKRNHVTEDSYLYGYNFQEQWDRAIKTDTPIVLVTGWNEWVAQRQRPMDGYGDAADKVIFVDTATLEFSRDIEMTRGGYFDNYYMQLAENIRQYKGTAPTLIQNIPYTIDITGNFSQWDQVMVTYRDFKGDTANRSATGFGNKTLTDTSGRNDIVAAKIAYDTEYLYFYVQCAQNITAYDTASSWMQLFINVDNKETGWYGFDYIVNYQATSSSKTTIAKASSTATKTYRFTKTSDTADYRVSGNEMMIRVPQSALGITDPDNIHFTFKWADSKTKITTMESFYTSGDSAPHGRMNFVFQNR